MLCILSFVITEWLACGKLGNDYLHYSRQEVRGFIVTCVSFLRYLGLEMLWRSYFFLLGFILLTISHVYLVETVA